MAMGLTPVFGAELLTGTMKASPVSLLRMDPAHVTTLAKVVLDVLGGLLFDSVEDEGSVNTCDPFNEFPEHRAALLYRDGRAKHEQGMTRQLFGVTPKGIGAKSTHANLAPPYEL